MKHFTLTLWPSLLLGVIVFSAWGNLAPFITAGLAFVWLSACVALGVLMIGWSVWRVRSTKEDTALEAVSSVFASQIAPVQPAAQETAHAWRVAYLQITFIGHSKQSFSFRTLQPYYETNARRYWEHMAHELTAAGWVVNKGGKVGMVFWGSYRRFSASVRLGEIRLAPAPGLPPPNVRWAARAFGTQGTQNTHITLTQKGTMP